MSKNKTNYNRQISKGGGKEQSPAAPDRVKKDKVTTNIWNDTMTKLRNFSKNEKYQYEYGPLLNDLLDKALASPKILKELGLENEDAKA